MPADAGGLYGTPVGGIEAEEKDAGVATAIVDVGAEVGFGEGIGPGDGGEEPGADAAHVKGDDGEEPVALPGIDGEFGREERGDEFGGDFPVEEGEVESGVITGDGESGPFARPESVHGGTEGRIGSGGHDSGLLEGRVIEVF